MSNLGTLGWTTEIAHYGYLFLYFFLTFMACEAQRIMYNSKYDISNSHNIHG